jgi:hypothetical protein
LTPIAATGIPRVTETPEEAIARLQRDLGNATIAKLQQELSKVRVDTRLAPV